MTDTDDETSEYEIPSGAEGQTVVQPDSDNHADFEVYANGEPVIIRGVEREAAETAQGDEFTDVWLHVDFVDDPDEGTHRVNISSIKCEGGAQALNSHLLRRGLVPFWWTENIPVPDSLDW